MHLLKIYCYAQNFIYTCILSKNPMDILNAKNSTNLFSGDAETKDIAYLLDLKGLWGLIKTNALLLSVIACLIILISMFFVHKAEMLQDKKKDLIHKLGIVLLFCSLITIFNIVKMFFDELFIG